MLVQRSEGNAMYVFETAEVTVGWKTRETICFDREWCQKFFELSEDHNKDLHNTVSGLRIVQGVAIVTKLGTVVSNTLPGYMVAKIGVIAFKQITRVGDYVHIDLECVQVRGSFLRVKVTLTKVGDGLITETELILREKN